MCFSQEASVLPLNCDFLFVCCCLLQQSRLPAAGRSAPGSEPDPRSEAAARTHLKPTWDSQVKVIGTINTVLSVLPVFTV